MHHHGQKPLPWRHWLKWVVVTDLDQQFLLAQIAPSGDMVREDYVHLSK